MTLAGHAPYTTKDMKVNEARLTYLSFLIALLFTVFSITQAADITFTEDTELELTGWAITLYILSDSEVDTFDTEGSILTVDIPTGSTFALGVGSPMYNVLSITPSGGSVTLTFDGIDFSGGYITQWQLDSTATTQWDILVGVSESNTSYPIKVDSVDFGDFNSNATGEISFTYTDFNLSNRIFTIAPSPSGGDCNNDSTVNLADLSMLLSDWNRPNSSCDFNNDGIINISDFRILLSNWVG